MSRSPPDTKVAGRAWCTSFRWRASFPGHGAGGRGYLPGVGDREEFDVEQWERRLREPAVRPLDRSRPDLVEFDVQEPDFSRDPFEEAAARETAAEVVESGFPTWEHNQWTVEGEIERFGAFGRGASRARGWKRVVALVMVGLILAPIVVALAANLVRVLG